jgi:hypothetical protein
MRSSAAVCSLHVPWANWNANPTICLPKKIGLGDLSGRGNRSSWSLAHPRVMTQCKTAAHTPQQ